jgi:hypothetical protein
MVDPAWFAADSRRLLGSIKPIIRNEMEPLERNNLPINELPSRYLDGFTGFSLSLGREIAAGFPKVNDSGHSQKTHPVAF